MPLLTIHRVTTYRYQQQVSLGEHHIMMRPREAFDQRLLSARLEVDSQPSELRWLHDVFGNSVAIALSSTGELGTVGKCLGGHLVVRAAFDKRLKAAACFYPTDIHSSTLGEGKCDDTSAKLGEMKGEALFVWGKQDPHIPFAGRQKIREQLEAVGAHYEWLELNAALAFMRDEFHRFAPVLAVRALEAAVGLFRRALEQLPIRLHRLGCSKLLVCRIFRVSR